MSNIPIRSLKSWTLFLFGFCALLSACSNGQIREPFQSSPTSSKANSSFAEVTYGDSAIVGHIGGPATSIHARGDYAYLGHSTEFAVVDISDPTMPIRVGYLLISALDMVVEEDVAYVAGRNGLAIVDISTPSEPRTLGLLPTGHSAIGIAKAGETVYLAVHDEGLYVVDVTEASRPVLAGTVPIDGRVAGVAVHQQHAYVVTNLGFHTIDATDATHPIGVGLFDTVRPAFSLTVNENVAYVGISGGILALDVTDPAEPVEIEEFPMAGTPLHLTVGDGILYSAAAEGLGTMDVSTTPSSRNRLADLIAQTDDVANWIDLPGASWDVTMAGGYAFVADGTSGMRSLHLDGSHEAEQIGRYAVPDAVRSVTVGNELAYIVDGNGALWTIDVGRPTDPRVRGVLHSRHFMHGAYSTQDVIYLSSSHIGYSLQTISLSGRASCQNGGKLDTDGLVTDVVATADVAYLAVENTGLQIVDVRRPCQPSDLGVFRIADEISDMVIVDQLAYLAVTGSEILIVDVSDPTDPALVSTLALNEPVGDLAVGYGHLYATTSSGKVKIVRIAPGTAPVEVPSMDIGEQIHEIAILNNRLYLATSAGVQTYGINEKGQPTPDALHPVPGGIEDIDVAAGVIYAAGGSDGLYIIQTELDLILGNVDRAKSFEGFGERF